MTEGMASEKETTEVKVEETKKSLKAKDASLWGQIIAVIWIMGFGAYYIIKNIDTLNPMMIIWFGISIVACFSPVYLNLLMEKICNKDID